MKEYAAQFYTSTAWRKTSRLYMMERHYVCERCGGVGCICHHKQYITPENINDPEIALNPDNLECLCQDCHNREHHSERGGASPIFDANGNMIGIEDNPEQTFFREAVAKIESITKGRQT